jgi:hypothetical protein
VRSGEAATLRWESNAEECWASDGWSGNKVSQGEESTGGLTEDTTYTLTCGTSENNVQKSVTITVVEDPEPVTIALFFADPNEITLGQDADLIWDSEGATTCGIVDEFGEEVGTGLPASGFLEDVVSPTEDTTYTLTCSGAGGSAQAYDTIITNTPCSDGVDNDGDGWIDAEDPGCVEGDDEDNIGLSVEDMVVPELNFVANPSVVAKGAASQLLWYPEYADWCEASGDWSGVKSASDDNEFRTDIMTNQTYELTCGNITGDVMKEVSVRIARCSDGVDNDGDGWIDAEDPGCYDGSVYHPEYDNESNTGYECSDGIDNDSDGVRDSFDPDCDDAFDTTEGSGTGGGTGDEGDRDTGRPDGIDIIER